MKKKLVCIILAVILILSVSGLVSACNRNKDEAADNNITIWAGGQWTGTDLQNLKAFLEEYNNTNSYGYHVEVISKSEIEKALATATRSNNCPDILIWDRFNTPTYAESDALLDVSSYIERDAIDLDVFNDEAMTELSYGGKYYGLPLDLDVWGTYVNMDKVDAYNAAHDDDIVLSDTWTWYDLYTTAKKLVEYDGNGNMTTAGYSGHVMHQHFFKYLSSTSQDFLKSDGTPNFDTVQARDVLEFFKKVGGAGNGIWENGLVEKSHFTSGKLAMIDQSLYFTDFIERFGAGINYKFMPQPRYSGLNGEVKEGAVNGGMLGGFGIAFPKPTKKYLTDNFYARFEVSWTFAKDWLLSTELQTKWSQAAGTLPSLKSLYNGTEVLSSETLTRAASFVDDYRIRPQIPGYLTIQTQVIDSAIKAFTEGKASVDETIRSLTNGCKEYM